VVWSFLPHGRVSEVISLKRYRYDLTPSLLMSYIYGAPCKARNVNVVYIYGSMFGNAESRLFLFAAQCFNIE
jgi:hypothetical protein